jgi:hypothetical protein
LFKKKTNMKDGSILIQIYTPHICYILVSQLTLQTGREKFNF